MRISLIAAAVACAAATAGAPTAAAQVHGFTSDNVEVVKNVPTMNRPSGGRLVGKHFFLNTGVDLTIYDVSDPEDPVEVGRHAWDALSPVDLGYLGSGYQEDLDTNGKIVIRGDGALQVVDVSDPTNPTEIGRLARYSQHTVSCVLDCTWVYGSDGLIADLRDPSNPKAAGELPLSGHDVTEVAPGLVLTASDPMLLLDARETPENPKTLATIPVGSFVHGTLWPRRMDDRFAISGGEALAGVCDAAAMAEIITWDTTGWEDSQTFKEVSRWHVRPGIPVTGSQPASAWCGHWFDTHPNFADGGPIAVAWYEQGVHFLQAGADGGLSEVGWFLPHAGSTWAAYWITDRIVYTTDHHRGIDILRFTGEIPPPLGQPGAAPGAGPAAAPAPAGSPSSAPPAPGSRAPAAPRRVRIADLVSLPSTRGCRRRLSVRVRRADDPVVRLELRVKGHRAVTASGTALSRPVRLRSLPRRPFSLSVRVKTRSGAAVTASRRYRPCR